ncbi:MAG: type IV pilus modification PilV family protein [Acidimicrobiales bacterium]
MPSAENRLGPESGATLIEVLVTVVILGFAVVAVVGALFTTIIGADLNRKQATARTVLVSAAETVKSQTVNPYQDCATSYDLAPVTFPAGWAAGDVSMTVSYWNGSGFSSSCAGDQKLQLVTLTATAPDAKAVESVEVVKRNPA